MSTHGITHPPSPSPSPPPELPTPLTPGPRAIALETIYNNALNSTLSAITLSSFESCFPTLAQSAPAALKSLHAGLIIKLQTFAIDEFERILEERKVVERLNKLEDLIAEGKRRRARGLEGEMVVVPHTLPPTALLSAHLSPIYTQQQSQLNAKLQTTASQNAALAEEVARQREEIERLMSLVEVLVKDLEGSVEGMEAAGVEVLSTRARDAESVLIAQIP